jgi:hypothetical protein
MPGPPRERERRPAVYRGPAESPGSPSRAAGRAILATMVRTSSPLLGANELPIRRPVVYLDQSTLGDAFEGTIGVGPDLDAKAELAALVSEVASRGTLCVSATHLIELTQWNPFENAFEMAKWLDARGPLWFQMEGATEVELEEEVGRRLGLEGVPPRRLLIHGTLMAAWREHVHVLSPEGTAELLRDPTIRGFTRQAHGKIEIQVARNYSVGLFKTLQEDRAANADKNHEEMAAFTDGKFRRHLEIEARRKINARIPIIGQRRPKDPEISAAVFELFADPRALPMNKVGPHLFREAGKTIVNSHPGSNRFTRRHSGSIWDFRHALAAAVTDVFTCDGPTDELLANFRTDRSLLRQVSLQRCGGMAPFVAELRRQCA